MLTLNKRRIIFYLFIFIFILAGFTAIIYSYGWKPSIPKNCQISKFWKCAVIFQKTGGIYIETEPNNVVIKINGEEFKDKSGLLQSGTLIENLLPDDYEVTVEKPNYFTWKKIFTVESGKVAKTTQIILIPKKIEKTTISLMKPIDNFWFNNNQIITRSNNSLYYYASIQNLPSNSFQKLRGDEFISFNENGSKIITQDKKSGIYYLYDVKNFSKVFNINASFANFNKNEIEKIYFHPFDSNRLIVETENGLISLDTSKFKTENYLEEKPVSWTIKNSNIYYIKKVFNKDSLLNDYSFYSLNLITKSESPIGQSLTYGKKITKIEVSNSEAIIAYLNENNNLFVNIDKNFQKISDNAKDFVFSPDSKRIAALEDNGRIKIYFFEDQADLNKKAGDFSLINLEDKKDIQKISWHENYGYLLVKYPNTIKLTEIDDREPINKYGVITDYKDFYYDIKSNLLYFNQENNLYYFEI